MRLHAGVPGFGQGQPQAQDYGHGFFQEKIEKRAHQYRLAAESTDSRTVDHAVRGGR